MATTPDSEAEPRAGAGWGWILGYGILSVLFGLYAFAFPIAATFAATIVVGAFFVAAGIVSIAAGFAGRAHEGRSYAIVFGIMSLVIGLVVALDTATGALSLTLLVVAWLATRGVLELMFGFRRRRGRGLMIALGLVNVVLALYVLVTIGWSAAVLPGFILGISFLFGGVHSIASALHHKQGASAFAAPEHGLNV
jgi:uncharacterized membrane protein HdeD (DUF308 family)